EHGRRARRDHVRVSGRRADVRLLARDASRRSRSARRAASRSPRARPGGRSKARKALRPRDRDRPGSDRAPRGPAAFSRPRAADLPVRCPEIVTALAPAGRVSVNPLTDALVDGRGESFRLEPPKPAPDVPRRGFADGRTAYVAPPPDGGNVAVLISPDSERLRLLDPWP